MSAPVVALHRMPSEVEARVRHACERAGALAVLHGEEAGAPPVALIGHLPRRARRIPEDVVHAANSVSPRLPVLLACDEPLVHPSTTLLLGGVTLVEHAATERLYSQLRIVLAAARSHDSAEDLQGGLDAAGPHYWLAPLAAGGDVAMKRDEALSLLLPLEASEGQTTRPLGEVLDRAHALASAGGKDVGPELVDCIGERAGFVHLAANAASWFLYWPAGRGSLWLFSSHRLPHLSELSRRSDAPRIFASAAAPGEIVFATSRPLGTDERAIADALADGGPAGHLRARECEGLHGFFVEVR